MRIWQGEMIMDNDFSANLNHKDKLANRVSALSPSKRALLEQRLKQKAVKTNGQEGIDYDVTLRRLAYESLRLVQNPGITKLFFPVEKDFAYA
jgi:hypothetical protein